MEMQINPDFKLRPEIIHDIYFNKHLSCLMLKHEKISQAEYKYKTGRLKMSLEETYMHRKEHPH